MRILDRLRSLSHTYVDCNSRPWPRLQIPAGSLGGAAGLWPRFNPSRSPVISGENHRHAASLAGDHLRPDCGLVCLSVDRRDPRPHPSESGFLGLTPLPARRTRASITSLRLVSCSFAIAVRISQQVSVRLTVRGRFFSPQRVRQSSEGPRPDREVEGFFTLGQPRGGGSKSEESGLREDLRCAGFGRLGHPSLALDGVDAVRPDQLSVSNRRAF
jgi:hypothetical protein